MSGWAFVIGCFILGVFVDNGLCEIAKSIWHLANAVLEGRNPQKITREMVDDLRDVSESVAAQNWHDAGPVCYSLDAIADALESYIPRKP